LGFCNQRLYVNSVTISELNNYPEEWFKLSQLLFLKILLNLECDLFEYFSGKESPTLSRTARNLCPASSEITVIWISPSEIVAWKHFSYILHGFRYRGLLVNQTRAQLHLTNLKMSYLK
jgi:hypothetical protein